MSTSHRKLYSVLMLVLFLAACFSFIGWAYTKIPQAKLFDKSEYRNLLLDLKSKGYSFGLPFENNSSCKVAVLIHDMDFSYKGAESLVAVEKELGVKSCFFLRPDSTVYPQSIAYFQGLQSQGWSVGFQYDSLSRADGNQTLALQLFKAQLDFMRVFFNVNLTTYHGDTEYRTDILNLDLYRQNTQVWQQLGLKEVYSMQNYTYITDTDAKLVVPENLSSLVLVQIHTDWYGAA